MTRRLVLSLCLFALGTHWASAGPHMTLYMDCGGVHNPKHDCEKLAGKMVPSSGRYPEGSSASRCFCVLKGKHTPVDLGVRSPEASGFQNQTCDSLSGILITDANSRALCILNGAHLVLDRKGVSHSFGASHSFAQAHDYTGSAKPLWFEGAACTAGLNGTEVSVLDEGTKRKSAEKSDRYCILAGEYTMLPCSGKEAGTCLIKGRHSILYRHMAPEDYFVPTCAEKLGGSTHTFQNGQGFLRDICAIPDYRTVMTPYLRQRNNESGMAKVMDECRTKLLGARFDGNCALQAPYVILGPLSFEGKKVPFADEVRYPITNEQCEEELGGILAGQDEYRLCILPSQEDSTLVVSMNGKSEAEELSRSCKNDLGGVLVGNETWRICVVDYTDRSIFVFEDIIIIVLLCVVLSLMVAVLSYWCILRRRYAQAGDHVELNASFATPSQKMDGVVAVA